MSWASVKGLVGRVSRIFAGFSGVFSSSSVLVSAGVSSAWQRLSS